MSWLDDVVKKAADRPPAEEGGPESCIIMGDSKVGKSTSILGFPRAETLHLICDPNGAKYLNTQWIDILEETAAINAAGEAEAAKTGRAPQVALPFDVLITICKGLAAEQPRRFKWVVPDKLDNIADWCDAAATRYFKTTPAAQANSKKGIAAFTGRSLLERWDGYPVFWDHIKVMWNALVKTAPHVLFLSAVKETSMESAGATVSRSDLDLTGKVRTIVAGYAAAIGLMTRNERDENQITFVTRDKGVMAGSRLKRLEGRVFKISWKEWSCCGTNFGQDRDRYLAHVVAKHDAVEPLETSRVVVDWSAIYPEVKNGVAK